MIKYFPGLLICFWLLSTTSGMAQRGHGSLYSTVGLGLPTYDSYGLAKRLGGVGAGVRSPYFLNTINPASQNSIGLSNTFILDVDVSYNQQKITTGNETISNNFSNFNYFSMWFRLSRKSTVSLGLSPVTIQDYSYSDTYYFEGMADKYIRIFKGWGNINKAYINYATNLGPRISVGIRPSFLFGNFQKEISYLDQYAVGFLYARNNSYTGLGTEAGIQINLLQNEKRSLTFGTSGQWYSKLNGTGTSRVEAYTGQEVLFEAEEVELNYQLGNTVRSGLSFQNKSWTIGADLLYGFRSADEDYSIANQVYSVGAEFIPNYFDSEFIRQMSFSLGANYDTGSIMIEGAKVSAYEVSSAVGIPLNRSSRLAIGYKYRSMGDIDIFSKESLNTITLNFTFGDTWFSRRKFE
ncbi:hypothetical protein SYJ56_03820 [Algoriphagus sp. D3-2-R+10]|uniref:hypothetical protein n=1 Tax=Algoriphagus aurantiacus TaxID=3103948 RepID=UPI002B37D47A|nr:hypothetical protein [Algoriphagus sp. D3-2-R+10]MEB2774417.1 hypothetical protein [Algoriphagus sp. D3-2-R+10]